MTSQLYPELTKIKPYKKEQSRQKQEFSRQLVVAKSKSKLVPHTGKNSTKNGAKKPNKTHNLQIRTEDLPEEIKEFLQVSKQRYPMVATENGSVYMGEMVNGN